MYPRGIRKRKGTSRRIRNLKRRRLGFGRRARRGTRYRGSRKLIKRVALSLAEAKRKDASFKFNEGTGSAWYHDTPYVLQLHSTSDPVCMTSIGGGTGEGQRNGNEVYSIGFRVRGTTSIPYDRRNVIYKMYLLEYNSNQGVPNDPTQLYRNVTGNDMLDPINNDRFPGLKHIRTFRVKSRDLLSAPIVMGAQAYATIYWNIWVPFKRHLRYNTTSVAAPVSGAKENLILLMVGYDSPDTATTSAIGLHHNQACTWYFKDP